MTGGHSSIFVVLLIHVVRVWVYSIKRINICSSKFCKVNVRWNEECVASIGVFIRSNWFLAFCVVEATSVGQRNQKCFEYLLYGCKICVCLEFAFVARVEIMRMSQLSYAPLF